MGSLYGRAMRAPTDIGKRLRNPKTSFLYQHSEYLETLFYIILARYYNVSVDYLLGLIDTPRKLYE